MLAANHIMSNTSATPVAETNPKPDVAADCAQDLAHDARRKAQEIAHDAGRKAREIAHDVGLKAQDITHVVSRKAQELAHDASQKAKVAAKDVVHAVDRVVHDTRERAGS